MTTPVTPPLPAQPAQPKPTTAPATPDFIPAAPVDNQGGELGHAALGALAGATESHAAANAEQTPDFIPDNGQTSAPETEKPHGTAYDVARTLAQPGLDYVQGFTGLLKELAPVEPIPADRANRSWLYRVTHPVLPVSPEDVALHGSMEHAGAFAENVMEFIGGDEALKGLSLAEKFKVAQKVAEFAKTSPKIAKAIDIGMTALRQGTVSGAQTVAKGGTLPEAVENAAITGGTSGVLGGVAEGAGALYRSIAKSSPEGIAAAKQAAADAGSELAERIAGRSVASPLEGAQDVKDSLAKAEDQMHADYAQGLHKIGEDAKNILVNVDQSPLQKMARELLTDSNVPVEIQAAAKGIIPEASRLDPLLLQFDSGKQYTWEQMEATRQTIGSTIRKLSYDSPLRKDLISLRGAIDETMQKSADDAMAQGGHAGGGVASLEELNRPGRFVKIGRSGVPSDMGKSPDFGELQPGEAGYQVKPDGTFELRAGQETPATKTGVQKYAQEVFGNNPANVAQDMKKLRSVYAEQVKGFNSSAIKTLADKNPNAVADVLLNKQSVFNVNTLRDLIGPKNMQPVEGQLLKRLIDNSSANGEFNPQQFVKKFNGLGTDVQGAIWGDNLPQVKDFLKVAQAVPKDSALWGGLARYMEHRALFDVALGGLAFGGLFGYGEFKGRDLLGPAAVLGAVIMLHNPRVLSYATKTLQSAGAAAVPAIAGAEQPTDQPDFIPQSPSQQ